ncbi:MAG: hypothetical protein HXS53_08325 [Theionarchaea archaeon]|nr:hypothetical protein [Theionarchaea archaeon]
MRKVQIYRNTCTAGDWIILQSDNDPLKFSHSTDTSSQHNGKTIIDLDPYEKPGVGGNG